MLPAPQQPRHRRHNILWPSMSTQAQLLPRTPAANRLEQDIIIHTTHKINKYKNKEMEEQGKRMSLMLKDVVKYWSSGALWNNNGGGGGAPSHQPDEGNSEGKGGPRRRRSSVKNSTNNDLQREPHTRDVTAVFEHMRRSYRTRGNKQLELIMNKKTKLSYDRKAKEEEARNRSSYGLLWKTGSWIGKGDDPSYNGSVDEQDSAKYVYKCSLCAAPFKMLIRKKYQCPLCERYVCSSCVTERVELDPVFFNEEAVTIMVCKNCKLYVQQGEEKQQFEEALERADNHPLVYYHGILSEILQLLSTLLPKFTDMVLAEDVSVENLKAAGKLEVHLLELFRNFDIGVKKVVAIPLDDPRDKRIQANIKLSLVNFLQENLMKFKALQKQRKELLAQAMEDERSGKKKISSKNDKGVGDTEREPFIISFEPAMSPMAGTIISIHGENFFKDTVVLIDGAKCKTKFVAKDNLICQSPILFEEGLKDIEVINPDKRSYKLSRVLFYSQDKELFSKQSKVQTNPEGQGRTGMSDKGKETAGSALSSLAGIEGKEHDSLQELVATMPDSEVLLNTTSTAAGSVASGKPSQRSFIEDSSLPGIVSIFLPFTLSGVAIDARVRLRLSKTSMKNRTTKHSHGSSSNLSTARHPNPPHWRQL
ncbi:carboxypeptidase Y-deficient [Balamuthia mandrillaris]